MHRPGPPRTVLVLLLGLTGCGAGSDRGSLPPLSEGPPGAPAPQHSPSPGPANRPPSLEVRVTPTPISGSAPLTVNVNLCRSSDPDADLLSYVYEYQGEGKRFSPRCQERHVYTGAARSRAVFCVSDGMPRHLICRSFLVTVE